MARTESWPVTRREFLGLIGGGAAGFALPTWSFADESIPASAARGKPNVLFIAIDDLNDWVGCLGGHPEARTPNLDSIAAGGVLFTRAHCSAPACNPSRASLLTGILPSTSGVYLNSQPWRPVMPDAVTLQQHFMAHGYRVMGAGKIFHGRYKDAASWQEYERKRGDPRPAVRPVNGIPNAAHFDWGPVDVPDEKMDDFRISSWVVNKLKQKHDRPFFLACGIFRPHLPWYAPRKYFDMFPPETVTLPNVNDDDLDDVPLIGRRYARPQGDHTAVKKAGQWRQAVSAYLACGTFADMCVGRVIDALKKSPYANDTVVILWADHGWHLGEKLHWRKFALWEEATRMPMMMSVPGVTSPGGKCGRTVSLLDIYPTLIDVCGLKPRDELEGLNLRPLLENPQAPWERPALTTHGRNCHSLRSERWRYIRYRDGTEELYDHDADELEWHNLAQKPEYSKTKQDLARWLPKVNAPDAPRDPNIKKKKKKKKKK